MAYVETFVVFDMETTGLPFQEQNNTKITEITFLAVSRKDIRRTEGGGLPVLSKLSLLINPERKISDGAAGLTGLTNDKLKYAPTFKEKFKTIFNFLNELKKPTCLIAHNGNIFDFRILLAECKDAELSLPTDLLCVDSMVGFKKLEKNTGCIFSNVLVGNDTNGKSKNNNDSDLLTDDEDEWPDLNITSEELDSIDELCASINNVSCEKEKNVNIKRSYKLTDLYKQLCRRNQIMNAHRAENDCIMLLQCIIACQSKDEHKSDFLKWADENCRLLTEIAPLKRKYSKYDYPPYC